MRIIFLFIVLTNLSFGQRNLSEMDTVQDFQQRFYKDGKLNLNGYYVYSDSNFYYDFTEGTFDYFVDTANMERVKQGRWVEYFDKDFNETDSSNYKVMRLAEYEGGSLIGKAYHFNNKGELHQMVLRYPELDDTVFEGVRRIYYKHGIISYILYDRFNEDTLPKKYWYYNSTFYYKSGQMKSHSLTDERNYLFVTNQFNRDGSSKYELYLSKEKGYTIRRKRKRTKEILTERIDSHTKIRTTIVNGKVISVKQLSD